MDVEVTTTVKYLTGVTGESRSEVSQTVTLESVPVEDLPAATAEALDRAYGYARRAAMGLLRS